MVTLTADRRAPPPSFAGLRCAALCWVDPGGDCDRLAVISGQTNEHESICTNE